MVGETPIDGRNRIDEPSGVGQSYSVNENHKQWGSDEWRAVVRDAIPPWALRDVDLGDQRVSPTTGSVLRAVRVQLELSPVGGASTPPR